MLIGAMNHPQRRVLDELEWMADCKLDFIDLSLEPPGAPSWAVNASEIRDALRRLNLHAVGHTAYYLPLASPFEEIRKAAVAELRRCMHIFAEIGVRWMNIHPDRPAPMHSRAFCIARNLHSLHDLLPLAEQSGVGLMIENLPGNFNTVAQLAELLDPLPQLGLHLDVGHCNLLTPFNTAQSLIEAYGRRICHVHLHDNSGGSADLHLPLGAGNLDVTGCVRALKRSGYDATITLEVFSEDRHYLLHSRDLLRQIWAAA